MNFILDLNYSPPFGLIKGNPHSPFIHHVLENKNLKVTCLFVVVLLEFRNKHKRDPQVSHLADDKQVLATLRSDVMDRLKVDKDKVPENFAQ